MACLSVPLILTGVWFAIAMVATVRGRRGGRTALASFLVTEVAFYAVHNASGAFGADLPLENPVLLIASALGYASAVGAGLRQRCGRSCLSRPDDPHPAFRAFFIGPQREG